LRDRKFLLTFLLGEQLGDLGFSCRPVFHWAAFETIALSQEVSGNFNHAIAFFVADLIWLSCFRCCFWRGFFGSWLSCCFLATGFFAAGAALAAAGFFAGVAFGAAAFFGAAAVFVVAISVPFVDRTSIATCAECDSLSVILILNC
jgi:hypothetical protein